jgi:hypothetical protein
MVFEDVTPIMVLGEARKIAPGKVLVRVSTDRGLDVSAAADIAMVALGTDRKAIGAGHLACRTHPVSVDRSIRLLTDVVRFSEPAARPRWHGCIFEVSTLRLAEGVEAVALVGDGLDPLVGDLVVTVEDGRSDPHVFPVPLVPSNRSAVLATVYRHADTWKLRAVGMAFTSDRAAIASQLGMKEAWPKPDTRDVPAPRPSSADGGSSARPAAAPTREPADPAASRRTTPQTNAEGDNDPPPLDMARLSALERDTEAVKRLLTDIFNETPSTPPKIEVRSAPDRLDHSHAAILRSMMASGSVIPSEFERIARDNGQMASGAEATINDWSFDIFGDLSIISDGESFSFNEELRKPIENLG